MRSGPPQRRGKGGKPDQHRAAAALQPGHPVGACHLAAKLCRQQRIGQRIDPAKADKGGDHHPELRCHRRRRVDELRHEGHEETDRFRVEKGDKRAVAKGRAARFAGDLCQIRRRGAGGPDHPPPHPGEVGGSGPFHRGEQGRRGRQDHAKPEQRRAHRQQIAEDHPGHHRQRHAAPLRQRIGHHQQNCRPWRRQQNHGGEQKGEEQLKAHASASPCPENREPDMEDGNNVDKLSIKYQRLMTKRM